MFKWSRNNKTAKEPKTPKLPKIPLLPDSPISYYQQPYNPNPYAHYSQVAPARQAMAPMVDPRYSHREPISTRSRSRTTSTPTREVKAPTPIWPHPSQGQPIPDLKRLTRANSTQAHFTPVAVPSVAFFEEMAQRKPVDVSLAEFPISITQSSNHFVDKHALRKAEALAKKLGTKVTIAPSKAFLEEQAEKEQAERDRIEREWAARELAKKQKHQSYEEFAPISTMAASKCQIEDLRRKGVSEEMLSKMLKVPSKAYLEEQEEKSTRAKSVLKKSNSVRPTPKSILKKGHLHGETKAYYSEDESARRERDRRSSLQIPKEHARSSTVAPSVGEVQGGWSSRYPEPAIRAPVHEIHPSTFRPTNSTSTGSADSAAHEYHRSRRASHTDTHFPASNYIRPYIRESPPGLSHQQEPTHVELSWPLVEYEQRRPRGQPIVTFDAGFNPRLERYAVRTFRPGDYVSSPLSRQDSVMQLSETAFVNWIVITCDKLPLWPIEVKQMGNLRVIDIFRAIYETYAQPLTQQELMHFGRATIERCEAAFKQRCEDGPELACLAERRGMLRIDTLRGRRIFKGLYPDRGKVGHYKLLFDDGPPRRS